MSNAFYRENGYLHVPGVFTAEETDELARMTSTGWSGSGALEQASPNEKGECIRPQEPSIDGSEASIPRRKMLNRLGAGASLTWSVPILTSLKNPGIRSIARLGLVLPVIGWIVAVVLLWISEVWSTRDKVIGTLVFPGGLLLPLGMMIMAVGPAVKTSCVVFPGGDSGACGSRPAPFGGTLLGSAVLALLVVAPIVVAIYLGRRLRGARPAASVNE